MSDFIGDLLERARGDEAAVLPPAAVYDEEPAEPFEVVDGEGDASLARPDPGPPEATPGVSRARPTAERRPVVAPPPEAPRPEPRPAPGEPVQQNDERAVRPPEPPPLAPERPPTPPAAAREDPPRPRRFASRRPSPHVDLRSLPAAIPDPSVVPELLQVRPRPTADERAAPVRPAERPRSHRPPGPRPVPTPASVERDVPALDVRERLVHSVESPAEPPTIHVSIGRVEVRAPAAVAAPSPPQLARPKQSLDDYLRARDRGRT